MESKEFLVDTYDRQHRAQAEGSCDESRINPASLPLYILKQIEDCHIISHFDQHVWRLFGFESEQHMHEEFSARDVSTISIPLLLVQPLDDPLHQVIHIMLELTVKPPNFFHLFCWYLIELSMV